MHSPPSRPPAHRDPTPHVLQIKTAPKNSARFAFVPLPSAAEVCQPVAASSASCQEAALAPEWARSAAARKKPHRALVLHRQKATHGSCQRLAHRCRQAARRHRNRQSAAIPLPPLRREHRPPRHPRREAPHRCGGSPSAAAAAPGRLSTAADAVACGASFSATGASTVTAAPCASPLSY